MTLLAPLWFALAAAAALGVVALHFITTARAPQLPFPTARFVPEGTASASARSARPTDLLLLAVRVLALLFLGAAFARPVLRSAGGLRRVVVADATRDTGRSLRDSVAAYAHTGDSVVRVGANARGALSAGIAAALPAARRLARGADSVELVFVSPFTADEMDSATVPLARAWPGRLRVVRVAAAAPRWPAITIATAPGRDDPLAATAALLAAQSPTGPSPTPVRVVRTAMTAADSSASRGGTAVVVWPRAFAGEATARGVTDGRATLVAPLGATPVPDEGVVVARWADGTAAAVEREFGNGCVRTVGIGLADAGDVALQPAFVALARTLLGPCVLQASWPVVSDSVLSRIERGGAAASAAVLRAGDDASPLAPWLLMAAFVLLLVEAAMRRASGRDA